MFSAVGGKGLRSFLPPTVTWCLAHCTDFVSNLPGGVDRQPDRATEKRRDDTTTFKSRRILLLDHVHDEQHRAVAGSAETTASSLEVARCLRRHVDFGDVALGHGAVDMQPFYKKAVRHVVRGERERDGLTLFQGNFRRRKRETVGVNLDPAR